MYMSYFDWEQVEIIKIVKANLSDSQLNEILNYILNSKVTSLVVSNNNLTDICLDALLHFVSLNKTLKNVYLSSNYINTLKSRAKILMLKENITLYI